MAREEVAYFTLNLDGQIVYKDHDTGKQDSSRELINYVYANGQAVGESGQSSDGTYHTLLDDGRFARIDSQGRDLAGEASTKDATKHPEALRQRMVADAMRNSIGDRPRLSSKAGAG